MQTAAIASTLKGFVLCAAALVVLLGGGSAHADAPDRYRCVPTDGSPTYTTPGTCHGDVLRREPLSREEIAELWEIKSRGRPYYRCRAADGRYSTHVYNGEACPSPTDTRTIEYARKSIEQQQYDEKIVNAAAASVGATVPSQSLPAATSPATPVAAMPAQATPVPEPTVPAAAGAPPAAAVSAAPMPSSNSVRSPSRVMGNLGWLVLVVLGIWGVSKWRSWGGAGSGAKPSKPRQRPAPSHQPKHTLDQAVPKEGPTPSKPIGDGIDMDQKAQELLAVLAHADASALVPGGLAFSGALKQAKLDYSTQSLVRVDQLLNQIKAKFAPQRTSWQDQPGTENFCLLLAFYLGTIISRQSNRPMQWYTHAQAAPLMPPDMPLPDANWSRLVGVIAASACLPLGVIEDTLFSSEPPAITCKAYVERFIGRLANAPTPDMDENKRCALMLDRFFSDAPIHGGLAYREQLKQAQLDYSLLSLQRLDQLLRFLQPEIKPPYTDFINDSQSQNFMRLAAFYVGMTVARLGGIPVKWLDFAQAKKEIAELEFQFETSSVCLLGGRVYFPLGLVTEVLLHPNAQRSLPEWARQVLQVAPPMMPSILRSSMQTADADPLSETQQAAIQKAGFMAAMGMFMVEGGTNGAPTMFVPGADGTGMIRDFSFYGDGDSAFKAAHSVMDENPDGVPYQAMSFDGYANLPTGRTDALSVDLRIYGGEPSSKKVEFQMTVVCPYRNANDPNGFAIYSPKLSECSMGDAMHSAIFKHFYQGIASYKAQSFDWFKYLDERI